MLQREKRTTAGKFVRAVATVSGSSARPLANTPDKQPVFRGFGVVVGALLVVVVVGATLMAFSSEVRHQVAISFIPQPERYTELYFAGDGPTEAIMGRDRVVVNVPFTVANHEGAAKRYPYAVRVVSSAGALLARVEGSVEVLDGNMLTTNVAAEIPSTETWTVIEVELKSRSERIRFLGR